MERKNAKKCPLLNIIAFESDTTSSLSLEKDTCHWQSMCYETPLRFFISLREIFFKSGFVKAMKKYDESSLMQILQEFGTL